MPKRHVAFYLLVTFNLQILLINMSKLALRKPRPFWASDEVNTYVCSQGYGCPGDNAEFVIGSSFTMFFALIAENDGGCAFSTRMIWLLIILMIVAVSFLGRLELGVNSFGDLIFGTLLGIWTVAVSHFILR